MSAALDFVHPRGEIFSLLLVALALTVAAPRVALLVGLERRRVADLFWNAGIAFVVVGRAAYLLDEASGSLLDPLVAIRVQGGIAPIAGALAAAAVATWMMYRGPGDNDDVRSASGAWLSAWGLGLALAVTTYDLACPLRDACYGAQAPAPLGFTMSGFADTRLATPLVEAALMLLGLGLLLASWPHWRPGVPGLFAVLAVAGLRLGLTPMSVAGWPGLTPEVLVLSLVSAMGLAGVIVLQAATAEAPPPPTIAPSG
ncbi:MAG: hypothetical protein R3C39_08150 [Dehalococcoidia bacterium]